MMKLAFMVRNLNFKVKNDFKDKDRKTRETIENNERVCNDRTFKL